jgi:predicted Zn-dependent protease
MKVRVVIFGALALVVVACAVNPATGRREFMLVTESQEIQMGQDADPQISASYGVVEDQGLQDYVSRLGMQLAEVSERPQLPWSFKVVDDPIVNAFALPGGFIYVTRGILAQFDSEAELAGVLGHEVGHVTARHGASQMSRQQLQQASVGLGMVMSERFRHYGGLAVGVLQVMNMSYSRGDESESDRLGLRYITDVGYHADAMIGVFQMLAAAGGGVPEGRLPEWQSTHPYLENREADMRATIAETGASPAGLSNRDVYLDMIDGLAYGENPRNGYFEDQRFLHPDLAFELTFPDGWQTENQRSAVAAIAPGQNAAVMLGVVDDGVSPEAELRDFLRGDGVTGGTATTSASGGIAIVRAPFTDLSQDRTLEGEVAFIRYGDFTYRMLGYSTPDQWGTHARSVRNAISSFTRVVDRSLLEVQPLQLSITTVSEAMSLNTFIRSNPQPISVEELARLNRLDPTEVISAGTRIKAVSGTPIG